MLHRVDRHPPARREPRRVPRAEEVGVQVVRDGDRLDVEDRDEVRKGLFQRSARRRVVEVADVLRDERLVAAGHADGVLEVAADRDDGRPRALEPDRAGRVAAGAADELPTIGCRAHDAVVAADDDVAVVHEIRIGDSSETRERLVVAGDQRLAARVRTRHHERELLRIGEPRRAGGPAGRLVEQQVLQRRVREHRAEPRESRRDAGQLVVGAVALAQQHDRPLRAFEQRALRRRNVRPARHRCRSGDHHGERLFLARLALAQPRRLPGRCARRRPGESRRGP